MSVPVSSPWRPRRNRDAERELKREAVLRAASQIFNEKGFQATTLDEIAASLQVSKPTLYYYVESKDEILFECVRTGLTMLQQAIAEVDAEGGRAIDKLMAAMRKYGEIVTMDFGMCLIRVGEDPLPKEKRVQLRRMKAGIDHEFRQLITEAIEEGSIAPCDPRLAAFTVAGALSWIGRWYKPGGDLRPEDIMTSMIQLLTQGLFVREAAVSPKPKRSRSVARESRTGKSRSVSKRSGSK